MRELRQAWIGLGLILAWGILTIFSRNLITPAIFLLLCMVYLQVWSYKRRALVHKETVGLIDTSVKSVTYAFVGLIMAYGLYT
jgi:hypothetical protein